MARGKNILKPRQTASSETDAAVLAHIRSLGLRTVEEYQDWCERHGFSRRTSKHWREQQKERWVITREAAVSRMTQKKHELRKPEKIIECIFRGEIPESGVTQPHLAALCRSFEATKQCRSSKKSALRLLLHVCGHADLLSAEPVISEYGWQEGNTFVEGLVALAHHAAAWIRPVEDWKPRTHNSHRQFASLSRHLFGRWPVPGFMDSVWFQGKSEPALRRQRWFLHLGRGENIRTADLPIPYTKRMAHFFMQAPPDLSVEGALRWGQIHALGGNERLLRAIVSTRLGTQFDNDDFWSTVIGWFIAHPMLDSAQVGPIIDFIQDQRFTARDAIGAMGLRERREPPQPNFTMKGRTPESLIRQVEAWHRQLARSDQPPAEWAPAGIAPLELTEGLLENGSLKIWTVTELLSSKALTGEGRQMNHCVGSYARSCAQGRSSIWTLEMESAEGKRKLLTVEVNNAARLICQARGKCNSLPTEKQRGVLRRWAERAGLRLASYV